LKKEPGTGSHIRVSTGCAVSRRAAGKPLATQLV
jgi:hypothetical protein